MPKKKVGKQVKKAANKHVISKPATTRKASAKKTASRKTLKRPTKSAVSKRVATKVVPSLRSPLKAAAASPVSVDASANPEISLGRPLVTQEEKLYMLFHDDYQARQVFEFLRVENVKELEQFSQQQIVHMMSKPLRMTVDRIRQRLAQYKRSLKDDEQFAADYLKHAD